MKNQPVLLLLHPEPEKQYLIYYVSEGYSKGYIITKPQSNTSLQITNLCIWPSLLKCMQHLYLANLNLWASIPIPLQPAYETDIAHFAFLMQLENPTITVAPQWFCLPEGK